MDKRWIIVGALLALGVGGWVAWNHAQPPRPDRAIITLPDGAVISAEISDTTESRELGLSGRDELAEGLGMLFIFDQPGQYPFWMRAMKFPIDIVWVMDTKVVFIASAVSPAMENQLKTQVPTEAANRVLELPAGDAILHKVTVGSTLDIRLPSR